MAGVSVFVSFKNHIAMMAPLMGDRELKFMYRLGDVINRWRVEDLHLESVPATMGPDLIDSLKVPFTYCWSPALVPKPQDWGSNIGIQATI